MKAKQLLLGLLIVAFTITGIAFAEEGKEKKASFNKERPAAEKSVDKKSKGECPLQEKCPMECCMQKQDRERKQERKHADKKMKEKGAKGPAPGFGPKAHAGPVAQKLLCPHCGHALILKSAYAPMGSSMRGHHPGKEFSQGEKMRHGQGAKAPHSEREFRGEREKGKEEAPLQQGRVMLRRLQQHHPELAEKVKTKLQEGADPEQLRERVHRHLAQQEEKDKPEIKRERERQRRRVDMEDVEFHERREREEEREHRAEERDVRRGRGFGGERAERGEREVRGRGPFGYGQQVYGQGPAGRGGPMMGGFGPMGDERGERPANQERMLNRISTHIEQLKDQLEMLVERRDDLLEKIEKEEFKEKE